MLTTSRLFRLLALASVLVLLAACSDKTSEQPVLAHVPADTPFVFANMEPIKPDVLDAWLSKNNAQLPNSVRQFREAADDMKDDAPHLAGLMNAMADEMDGKTFQQVIADSGIDVHGHFAWYGLGLSPVFRGQLKDPAKFKALVDRMAKAGEITLEPGSTGKVDYRRAAVPEVNLQMVFAHHDGQFAIALLPADAPPGLLKLAVGADSPSAQDSVVSRLEQLADEQGYLAQGLGYLDTGRLLADLASGKDALLKAMLATSRSGKARAALTEFNGPGCQDDLKRIAARVPQISFGYTRFDAHQAAQRMNIELAPDITAAFDQVKSTLPGLGKADSTAPVNVALALPLPAIRDFWMAQANAVASKPFTCKPLRGLNKAFTEIGQQMPKTAIPPFGNLRGLHVLVDQLQAPAKDGMPAVEARAVLALKDPQSVLAMAKAMLQPLNQLDIKPDGRPVALPESLSQFTGEPVWLAMNDHAIAVGIGADQKDKLDSALNGATGEPGQLLSSRFDGPTLARWIRAAGKTMTSSQLPASNATTAKVQANMQQSFESAARSYDDMKQLGFDAHMDKHGLVIESEVRLK